MSSSAGQRELLKLTRLAHNRLCADCKVSLGEQRILASLRFQVFICEACSEQHVAILGQSAQIRVATGDGNIVWSKEDVAKMHAAGNNVAVNNTLERFVPQDWKKLSPSSSTEERRKWISAKYDVLYFSFPDGLNYTAQQLLQYQQQRLGSKSKKSGKKGGQKDDASLPVRIADFFLTVGPGECRQYGKNFQNKNFMKVRELRRIR
jgi:Putative GTPase activating protein for Arf